MGKPRDEMPPGSFSAKKESDLSPVDPCQGWVNPCDFCDKRFGVWADADEENLAKVPPKPGVFQMAFKSKNNTEIVSIILHPTDVQKVAYETVDNAKELIADKKSKFTKTVLLCRWMTFKKNDDKDIVVLYAHWHNNGILPNFLKSWPGLDILRNTDVLTFSDKFQKWCYLKKDTFWRKPKPQTAKLVEVVKSCKWTEPCEICDAYFSKWERLDGIEPSSDKVPNSTGLYEVAVRCGQKVDRLQIECCLHKSFNVERDLRRIPYYWIYSLKKNEYGNKNAFLQVRWIALPSPENDNSCFLYAHLLNGHPDPNTPMEQAEKILEKNKHFLSRNRDDKWCYVLDDFKERKITKFKQRKNLLNELEDDILYLNLAEN